MRYVIQALPTEAFFGEKDESPLISENFRDNLLLFGFSFDAPDEVEPPTRDDIYPIIDEVKEEFSSDQFWFDVRDVRIEQGSVVITILVGACVATVGGSAAVTVGAGALASGAALWFADKLFGGALSEFGKEFANRTKKWIFKDKSGSSSDSNKGPDNKPIFNADEEAEKSALRVALQHGCSGVALMRGGIREEKRYRYKFRFTGRKCRHEGVIVWVDPYDEHVKSEVKFLA